MARPDRTRRWEPSDAAFQRLLTWLDQGADSQGERYLDIRDRLVHYFARRNGPAPDDLADETLNRVARRLEESGSIDNVVPAQYCYIVAKFVLLESLRARARQPGAAPGDGRDVEALPMPADDGAEERERTLACLERCIGERPESERRLILEYYRTEAGSARAHRQQLAERLGLTANALALRACRIRGQLERCVRACRER